MNHNLEVLEKLSTSLRAVGAQSRLTLKTKGFDVFLNQNSDDYFLSFAVPKACHSWPQAIQEMQALFKNHNRRARLEYFDDLHPALKDALKAADFHEDMRAPVMALESQAFLAHAPIRQGSYKRLSAKDVELIKTALRQQSLAYGGDGGEAALVWLHGMLEGLKDNKLMLAVLEKDGLLVSGASLQIGGGIGELAGVWTHPEQQKKGFAFELCHDLLTDYFSEGFETCWLSAAEGAQRLYENLGFTTVGTQLNYGLPE